MKSIAIIGASSERSKFGNKAVLAYTKAGYDVYPVNPKEEEIEGHLCYPDVMSIPIPIELVSLYVPAKIGLKLVAGLKDKG